MSEFLAKHDGTKLQKLDSESYQKMLRSLKQHKAPDLFNCQLEHFLFASEETADYMVTLTNEILEDPSLFAHTAISRSLASMLYKGKSKSLELIGSYRRIQICTVA